MPLGRSRGFTLIELLVAVTIMGLVLTFSVPGIRASMDAQRLKTASESIASQVRLARSTAMASGSARRFCFAEDSAGYDYHVHLANGTLRGWSLPDGIHYDMGTDTTAALVFQTSGRASQSLNLVLHDRAGTRDSVTIQVSGYLLVH